MQNLTVTVSLGDECTQTTHSERHDDVSDFQTAFGECVMYCASSDKALGIEAIAAIVESAMASLDSFESNTHYELQMAVAQIGAACEAACERLDGVQSTGSPA